MVEVPGVNGAAIVPDANIEPRLSMLGHQLAPPTYSRHTGLRIVGGLLVFVVGFGWLTANIKIGFIVTAFAVIVLGVTLGLIWAKRQHRKTETDAAMHAWNNSLVCFRCSGAFFNPETIPAEIVKHGLVQLDVFRATVSAAGDYLSGQAGNHS